MKIAYISLIQVVKLRTTQKKAYDANLAGILLELHYKALLKYEGASNTS